jgi:PEGA domain-containing protein
LSGKGIVRGRATIRAFASALFAALACTSAAACTKSAPSRPAVEPDEVQIPRHPDVTAAREFDRQGVERFRDGHYADAVHYFEAAYRLGGPSSELWNVARSREKLDDGEGACLAIDEYLARPDLSPQDRAEAEREARALRTRTSLLSVTTTPAGAFVSIDGAQAAGPTPISLDVSAGPHTIVVRRAGNVAETRHFEARFGRAIIVSLDLGVARK